MLLCVEKYALFFKNTFPDIHIHKLQNISKKPKIFEFFENSPLHPQFQKFIAILNIKKLLIFYSIFQNLLHLNPAIARKVMAHQKFQNFFQKGYPFGKNRGYKIAEYKH